MSLEHIKRANKPNPVVTAEDIARAKAGEEGAASYWKYSEFRGPTRYFKHRPRPSQTTSSEFLSRVYGLTEDIEDFLKGEVDPTTLADTRDGWVATAEEIRDETQEKFDNMPEGLQQGDTGQKLEGRVSSMEDLISSLEGLELDYDADEHETDEARAEWLENAKEEIASISYDGE